MHLSHYIAELECDILGGHIPSKYVKGVFVVNEEKLFERVADTTCENCGHQIVYGITKIRKK